MSDAAANDDSVAISRQRRAVSLRVLLLLVALLPVVGAVGLMVASTARLVDEREAAERLDDGATTLRGIVDARAAAADEQVAAAVLAVGAELGVSGEQLGEIYGVDFLGELAAARAVVDADPTLASLPQVADSLAVVRSLRSGVDRGTLPFAALHRAFFDLATDIDQVWARTYDDTSRRSSSGELPAIAQARLERLDVAYAAAASGSERAALTILVVRGSPTDVDLTRLAEAAGAYRLAGSRLAGAGPLAQRAWQTHLDDPASQRFEQVLDDVLAATLAGTTSPLSTDIAAFGDAFIDGPDFAAGLTATVRGAAQDLSTEADDHATGAARDLQLARVATVVLAIGSLLAALFVAQQVVRPIKRLEAAAQEIRAGRFDLPPIEPGGPRELADTAQAFNEMAAALATLEAHAMTLAADPDAPVPTDRLPGRMGRTLRMALDRVRTSMLAAEEERRHLEQAATHDGLTGLLNRSAALELIGKDLALAARGGTTVMALYIDLDGLKAINDRHGHAAGDHALRLAADALRSATRAADVVARIGGDEFVVAGIYDDGPDELETVAHRIRSAVAGQSLLSPQEVPLRCSIGLAVSRAGATVESLLADADAALYLAKARGRDQIAWFEEVGDAPSGEDGPADQPIP